MFELKKLTPEGIRRALGKVERYRLLNEPAEAESICRDVLRVEPGNQEARVTLLLALTDQFPKGLAGRLEEARRLASELDDRYERAYYSGLVCERHGKQKYKEHIPGCGQITYDLLRQAMAWYEEAEQHQPEGNDEAILRWNACARQIMEHSDIQPEPHASPGEPLMLE